MIEKKENRSSLSSSSSSSSSGSIQELKEELKRTKEELERIKIEKGKEVGGVLSKKFHKPIRQIAKTGKMSYQEKEKKKEGKLFKERKYSISKEKSLTLSFPVFNLENLKLKNPNLDVDGQRAIFWITGQMKKQKTIAPVFTKEEFLRGLGFSKKQIRQGGYYSDKASDILQNLWDNEYVFEDEKGMILQLRILKAIKRPKGRGKKGDLIKLGVNEFIVPQLIIAGTLDPKLLATNPYISYPAKIYQDRSLRDDEFKFLIYLCGIQGFDKFYSIKATSILKEAGCSTKTEARKKDRREMLNRFLEKAKAKELIQGWKIEREDQDFEEWRVVLSLPPRKRKQLPQPELNKEARELIEEILKWVKQWEKIEGYEITFSEKERRKFLGDCVKRLGIERVEELFDIERQSLHPNALQFLTQELSAELQIKGLDY